jgi:hypothetical protein
MRSTIPLRAWNRLLCSLSRFRRFQARDPLIVSASRWRLHIRAIFEDLFSGGYWVTDFVFLQGREPQLCPRYGDSTF